MDELLNHLLNGPKFETNTMYMVSFRFPSFKVGMEHGNDYTLIAREPNRTAADKALADHLAEETGKVFIREGRKVHTYDQNGVYLGHYSVNPTATI